jgi:multidrug efflux pump subunit AcrA (membrane-fusion protein)
MSAPYRISADARIQPITRRFVAAPFAGTLECTLVSPGDVVAQADVLARIDAREIQWELDGLLAEYRRVTKTRDSALANRQVAEAQLAKLEMDRIELRTQLLEHRIRHLEIKSPIDGVVVSGDLAKAEGAPLTMGQSLFEIAPLGEMLVEVAVPEDEIQYVLTGQEVVLRLDAYADSKWTANISKIHPRAEMCDDRNVFIVEFVLHDAGGILRPGMKGRAKITGPRRTLAWNWFHRPYEKLAQMWGW